VSVCPGGCTLTRAVSTEAAFPTIGPAGPVDEEPAFPPAARLRRRTPVPSLAKRPPEVPSRTHRNGNRPRCRDVGMTSTTNGTDIAMNHELEEPTGEPAWASADEYPRFGNISAGFMYRAVARPKVPERPEYVTIYVPRGDLKLSVTIANWNLLWEAAQFRGRFFDDADLPAVLRKITDRGDVNVVFVPRTQNRFHEYAPLFHLIPRNTAERHGLPLIRTGHWPFVADTDRTHLAVPTDFDARLSRAWAGEVWRHLMPGSPMRGFTRSDPIKLLAHNLDFWLPPVTEVMQQILRSFPVVDNDIIEESPPLVDGSVLEDAVMANPRTGGDLWRGEQEAAETVACVVDEADADGRLRGILDAVRSNRVEDDFSEYWTYAREDFERKLYRKRSKIKVRFVELTDTIPVQGPETEVVGQTVFSDFLALLDERDRQVVVLLNSGITKLTDIGGILGYSNHSMISKRMKRIRAEAGRFFSDD
jgi:hypothetical protein